MDEFRRMLKPLPPYFTSRAFFVCCRDESLHSSSVPLACCRLEEPLLPSSGFSLHFWLLKATPTSGVQNLDVLPQGISALPIDPHLPTNRRILCVRNLTYL
ncbi:hypothetical protein CSKR_203169 [Clonorchis sinensis]|uniref:Uncharacterized protein n=1 Tax=Clonorchis sinensis TaxID=79923 RepID=A0A8T1M6X1_CLOSI|nr:hypothetical protein CSKR_203169 [Clonorchis sinensis]